MHLDHPARAEVTAAPHAGSQVIVSVSGLVVGFGSKIILDKLDLNVRRGEILGFIGPSGSGKSVLTRAILGLVPVRSGTISVFGQNLAGLNAFQLQALERRFGVLFQQGALFSALTVKQNIQVPMREYLGLSQSLMDQLAMLKLDLVGLKRDAADKYPSELSGGMIKRAALARALALDPDILFLDEPTSGLDPIGAGEFDDLILTLQKTMGLTVFMVTHDLDSLYTACDRVAALGSGKIILEGPISMMESSNDPWLRAYFHGKRARKLNV
jgi:phospholipid/cholesterol/gamma-HCH transport system ATP-binding protein